MRDDAPAGDAGGLAETAVRRPTASRRLRRAPAAVVRARLAEAVLGPAPRADDERASATLGEVTLRPHQRDAVTRLRAALREFGGALLADEVGLGKTYAALAVAREARRPLVLAPAALRGVWAEAMPRTGVRAAWRSLESASRDPAGASVAPGAHDLVVVDEAHHLRNPATRRYRHVAALARGARVLLLTATPVHNRRGELGALLALFLGTRAAAMGAAELARCVVRRGADTVQMERPPRVLPPRWLHLAACDELPARLLALPPPLPPADGGAAGALVTHALVRQWSSSVGALRTALRRRLARAEALEAALAAGHHPSAAELRAWVVADDAVQLAFPELLSAEVGATAPLLAAVRAHRDGVRTLLAGLDDRADRARADLLRDVRRRHAGERVVAFSVSADTIAALYRELRGDGGVCALTGAGARVAGGPLTRREALRRFAPAAHGCAEPPLAERIDLLLSTDVLSEGVGLQDASVVVHLDLPWTPARLEQRTGRIARLGSRHAAVAVYAIAPPASAEALLDVERRLRAKLREAGRAVGVSGLILPRLPLAAGEEGAPAGARSPAESAERLRELLRTWLPPDVAPASGPLRDAGVPAADGAVPAGVVAAVTDPRGDRSRAFLAVVVEDGRRVLVAGGDGRPTSDDPAIVLGVATRAAGAGARLEAADAAWARERVRAWARERASRRTLAFVTPATARLQGELLRRVAEVGRRAPRHRRRRTAALAATARRAVGGRLGAGAERVLAELAAARMPDAAWLRAVAAFGEAAAGAGASSDGRREAGGRLRALLLVLPASRPSTRGHSA